MRPYPILIAGPTASGKSSLALELASKTDGIIVNADALQVYECWQILTARPSPEDCATLPHMLYGHVAKESHYSVGNWLRDLAEVLAANKDRQLVIVGGTGLYLSTLTAGLPDIPKIPDEIRKLGNTYRIETGTEHFLRELQSLDPEILKKIDIRNPMRLQRAWEVAVATGKPLTQWHKEPSQPLLPEDQIIGISVQTEPDKLRDKIDFRFDWMIKNGALEECQAMLETGWNPDLPSSRALGASELIEYLGGKNTLEDAVKKAKISTHQYAKRQRTWFRNRMSDWHQVQSNTDIEQILKLRTG